MKVLTIVSAVIDTIVIIDSGPIKRVSMLNAALSFLLLKEGRLDKHRNNRHDRISVFFSVNWRQTNSTLQTHILNNSSRLSLSPKRPSNLSHVGSGGLERKADGGVASSPLS